MFYYKTSFSGKTVFLKKTVKTPFVGVYDRFEGRGLLATKINVTFFVGIGVLNIFHLITFSKEIIFPKITAKNLFGVGGAGPFLREWGVRRQK